MFAKYEFKCKFMSRVKNYTFGIDSMSKCSTHKFIFTSLITDEVHGPSLSDSEK